MFICNQNALSQRINIINHCLALRLDYIGRFKVSCSSAVLEKVLVWSLRSVMGISHFWTERGRRSKNFLSLFLNTRQPEDTVITYSELKSGLCGSTKEFFLWQIENWGKVFFQNILLTYGDNFWSQYYPRKCSRFVCPILVTFDDRKFVGILFC